MEAVRLAIAIPQRSADAGLRMQAIAFDLGDTLIEYAGLPPSWAQYYGEALTALAGHLGVTPHPGQIGRGSAVLRGYNTRLHPREREVSFATILAELLPCFGVTKAVDELACARAFFDVFRKRLHCFDDVKPALEGLKARGQKLGVFTDAAYGMPREFIIEDIQLAGLDGFFPAIFTSVDVGFRKPAAETLQRVARELGSKPRDLIHVGNEEKDVLAAKAAGCRSVVIDRNDQRPSWGQDRTIKSLLELWVERAWF